MKELLNKKAVKYYAIFCAIMILIYGVKVIFNDNKPKSVDSSNPVPILLPQIFELSIATVKQNKLVIDASAKQEKQNIVLSIVVNKATTKEWGKELADIFVRQVISNIGLQKNVEESNLGKKVGKTKFNYHIIIGYSPEEVLLDGTKDSGSEEIIWHE